MPAGSPLVSLALKWVVGATLVMAAAMGIGRFAYTPLLPQMATEFGWDFTSAGDIASANFLGYMIGALLAPALARSPMVRLYLALSLMASVATTYLGAEISGYTAWLALRLLSGVASAFCLVLVTTHLMYVLARERREALGNVHIAGVGIGIIACMGAVLLAGESAAQWGRLGGLAAVMMAVAWLLMNDRLWRPEPPATTEHEATGSLKAIWRLIAGYGFFGFGYVVAATFVVAMAERLGTSTMDPRLAWLAVGIAFVPSVYLWQALANRWGIIRTLRMAYLVEAVGVVAAGIGESLAVFLFACVLLGGTFGAITALGLSAARFAAPYNVAGAVSAMTAAFALGQWLGPAIAGRMADYFGDFVIASLLAGALLLISAGLIARYDYPQRDAN